MLPICITKLIFQQQVSSCLGAVFCFAIVRCLFSLALDLLQDDRRQIATGMTWLLPLFTAVAHRLRFFSISAAVNLSCTCRSNFYNRPFSLLLHLHKNLLPIVASSSFLCIF